MNLVLLLVMDQLGCSSAAEYFCHFAKVSIGKLREIDRAAIYILDPFDQRSQYISIKFPLHELSENPWVCY